MRKTKRTAFWISATALGIVGAGCAMPQADIGPQPVPTRERLNPRSLPADGVVLVRAGYD